MKPTTHNVTSLIAAFNLVAVSAFVTYLFMI